MPWQYFTPDKTVAAALSTLRPAPQRVRLPANSDSKDALPTAAHGATPAVVRGDGTQDQ